jgi:hypothetical protein
MRLVETFVSSVYLWDDGRVVITYNYTGENSTVTLETAEEIAAGLSDLGGSDGVSSAPLLGAFRSIFTSGCSFFYERCLKKISIGAIVKITKRAQEMKMARRRAC